MKYNFWILNFEFHMIFMTQNIIILLIFKYCFECKSHFLLVGITKIGIGVDLTHKRRLPPPGLPNDQLAAHRFPGMDIYSLIVYYVPRK